MATNIPWCDETWNPITGCGPGLPCWDRCWARGMAHRLKGMGAPGYQHADPFAVRFHPDQLDRPLHWRKPRRIFVCSMGDWMHRDAEGTTWVDHILHVMDSAPQHAYLTLTKRPENFRMALLGAASELPQLWLGVSVTGRDDLYRIATLCETPAAHRWVNVGPWIDGPIDLTPFLWSNDAHDGAPAHRNNGPEWVCVECESGPKRRPMRWEWLADLIGQCDAADVPVFVKQACVSGIENYWREIIATLPNHPASAMDRMCDGYGTRVSHDPAEWPAFARRREFPEDLISFGCAKEADHD